MKNTGLGGWTQGFHSWLSLQLSCICVHHNSCLQLSLLCLQKKEVIGGHTYTLLFLMAVLSRPGISHIISHLKITTILSRGPCCYTIGALCCSGKGQSRVGPQTWLQLLSCNCLGFLRTFPRLRFERLGKPFNPLNYSFSTAWVVENLSDICLMGFSPAVKTLWPKQTNKNNNRLAWELQQQSKATLCFIISPLEADQTKHRNSAPKEEPEAFPVTHSAPGEAWPPRDRQAASRRFSGSPYPWQAEEGRRCSLRERNCAGAQPQMNLQCELSQSLPWLLQRGRLEPV